MSIPAQLKNFLEARHIAYTCRTHEPAYGAQWVAHSEHISGKQLAKVVIVRADNRLVMTVVPASHRLDLEKLQSLLEADYVRIASEKEFKDLFPDCELGAMPPFGNLYNLEVWVHEDLKSRSHIFFNAGTHRESIEMDFRDFLQLVQPRIGRFAELMH